MTNFRALTVALFFLSSPAIAPPADASLEKEMTRIGVRSALVIPSQAVDGHPVWSPAGDAIAAEIDGHWVKVDLRSTALEKGTWHGKESIGVLKQAPPEESVSESVVRNWDKNLVSGARRVVMRNGTSIELRQEGLSTAFVVTRPGGTPDTIWKTSLENCHGLTLSPDERYVAYVCEMNGVIVTTP
jgi:hypothetical protein